MTSQLTALLDHLARMASVLPYASIKSLSNTVVSLPNSSSGSQLVMQAATPTSEALYRELVELWQEAAEVSPKELSLALLSAQRAVSMKSTSQVIETVWTGPATNVVPVRRTEQALLEIIAESKHHLLIATFASQKLDSVISALDRAIQRGVNVNLLLELADESEGKIAFDAANTIRNALPKINVYFWPLNHRKQDSKGRYGSLHAKCAVADGTVVLVSSANLTAPALDLNIELGVLVRGGDLPSRIAAHFDELIKRGVFTRHQ